MKNIALTLILCSIASAQSAKGVFTYERTTAGSSEAVTLQLPSNSNRTAKLTAVSVYCVTACTAALSRDGTAATGTAGTVVKLNSASDSASVVPYYSSNVGAGTSIKNYNIAATEEKVIDLSEKGLLKGENITITPSLSGARVYFQWREY